MFNSRHPTGRVVEEGKRFRTIKRDELLPQLLILTDHLLDILNPFFEFSTPPA